MIGTAVEISGMVGLHAAGLRALNRELGADGAKMFMELNFGGSGDYTAEKKSRPPMSDEEYNEWLAAAKAESIAAGTWE